MVLTQTVEQLKNENSLLTQKLSDYLNSDAEERIQDLNSFHKRQVQEMEQRIIELNGKLQIQIFFSNLFLN